ncbi:hypothetical protein Hanom_Chr06g00487041 [Helianthus anomalus]
MGNLEPMGWREGGCWREMVERVVAGSSCPRAVVKVVVVMVMVVVDMGFRIRRT